jgi:hypothetical protein
MAGAGGKPGTGTTLNPSNQKTNTAGNNSFISGNGLTTIIANGGGRGGSRYTGSGGSGYTLKGGSGGGGAGSDNNTYDNGEQKNSVAGSASFPYSTPIEGNSGGSGLGFEFNKDLGENSMGGGGGGAGGRGSNGDVAYTDLTRTSYTVIVGNGGEGKEWSVNKIYYAGGGGGGSGGKLESGTAGLGGKGGGGNGSGTYQDGSSSGKNGINGLGGGGGGSCGLFSTYPGNTGGAGGNGIVILAWMKNPIFSTPLCTSILTNAFPSSLPGNTTESYASSTCDPTIFTTVSSMTYSQTGGIFSTDGNYNYITFSSSTPNTSSKGYFQFCEGKKPVYYLVVGGGGAGGQYYGGGGGAGGFLNGQLSYSLNTTYSVVAGGGGKPGYGTDKNYSSMKFNTAGYDSTLSGGNITTITAYGGGRGASFMVGAGGGSNTLAGGSGGGGTQTTVGGLTKDPTQGNNGGSYSQTTGIGGGGGGAGGLGQAGYEYQQTYGGTVYYKGGDGGYAKQWDINCLYYAGGGGGGIDKKFPGGLGGGTSDITK